jgi:hypothetical protein
METSRTQRHRLFRSDGLFLCYSNAKRGLANVNALSIAFDQMLESPVYNRPGRSQSRPIQLFCALVMDSSSRNPSGRLRTGNVFLIAWPLCQFRCLVTRGSSRTTKGYCHSMGKKRSVKTQEQRRGRAERYMDGASRETF